VGPCAQAIQWKVCIRVRLSTEYARTRAREGEFKERLTGVPVGRTGAHQSTPVG
jgi:hypothetical protein